MVAEGSSTMTPPIPYTRLRHITNDVCSSTFKSVDSYDHSQTEQWNTNIIQSILQSLISETSSPESAPSYKYAVNSTIIQHQLPSTSASASTSTPSKALSTPPTSTASTSTTTDVTGANEASTADETHPVPGGADDERVGARTEGMTDATTEGVTGANGSGGSGGGGGARRGMHSATGAYWNTEKDGMWSYKYEGGEAREFDVVICVIWMAV